MGQTCHLLNNSQWDWQYVVWCGATTWLFDVVAMLREEPLRPLLPVSTRQQPTGTARKYTPSRLGPKVSIRFYGRVSPQSMMICHWPPSRIGRVQVTVPLVCTTETGSKQTQIKLTR